MSSKPVFIPDSAVYHIMNGYLLQRHTEGVPVSLGISHETVEAVLDLFLDWANTSGIYKDGILDLNNMEVK